MSNISKISFVFAAISFVCLLLGRLILGGWINILFVPLVLFLVFFCFPFIKEGGSFVHNIFGFMQMKTTKRGLSMGSMIFLVIAALSIINVISVRHYAVWDFSAAKSNTLSDQSIQLLKSLDSELKILFFYKQGQADAEDNRRAFRELAKKYQDQSDKVHLEFIEVNERPDVASQYAVNKGSGIAFVEYKGRRNRIEKIDEQDITSGLMKITREKNKLLYYVTGHGEIEMDEVQDTHGGNALKMLLTNNSYDLKPLALGAKNKVPADADAVLIVAPQQNYLDFEISGLEEYLKNGGSILMALDAQKSVGLEKLLAKMGIQPLNNVVLNLIDTSTGQKLNAAATIVPTFSVNDEITKVFPSGQMIVFQTPMGLKKTKVVEGILVDEILQSLPDSLGFKTMAFQGSGEKGLYTFGMDVTGNFPGGKGMRVVVFGDGHFMDNSMLYQNLNRDLTLNSIAALVHQENLISIAPRDAGITQMQLTDMNFRVFFWGFVLPLPLLLLAASVGLWLRRRHA